MSQILRRLRHKNHLNPGGIGCSELRVHHCILAWTAEQNSISKNKQTNKQKICNYLVIWKKIKHFKMTTLLYFQLGKKTIA